MAGWLLPAAATGAWLGALLGRDAAAVAPWWAWGAFAVGLLVVALALAPTREPSVDHLAAAGLVTAATAAATRLDPGRVTRGAAPAVVFALAGVAALSMSRAALAEDRRASSPLVDMGFQRVVVVAALREDLRAGLYGWHGVATALRVEGDGAAIALREPVWIGGDGRVPHAVRGDIVRLQGGIDLPDDSGFADGLARRGIAVTIRVDLANARGPLAQPGRSSHPGRPQGHRELDRRSLP